MSESYSSGSYFNTERYTRKKHENRLQDDTLQKNGKLYVPYNFAESKIKEILINYAKCKSQFFQQLEDIKKRYEKEEKRKKKYFQEKLLEVKNNSKMSPKLKKSEVIKNYEKKFENLKNEKRKFLLKIETLQEKNEKLSKNLKHHLHLQQPQSDVHKEPKKKIEPKINIDSKDQSQSSSIIDTNDDDNNDKDIKKQTERLRLVKSVHNLKSENEKLIQNEKTLLKKLLLNLQENQRLKNENVGGRGEDGEEEGSEGRMTRVDTELHELLKKSIDVSESERRNDNDNENENEEKMEEMNKENMNLKRENKEMSEVVEKLNKEMEKLIKETIKEGNNNNKNKNVIIIEKLLGEKEQLIKQIDELNKVVLKTSKEMENSTRNEEKIIEKQSNNNNNNNNEMIEKLKFENKKLLKMINEKKKKKNDTVTLPVAVTVPVPIVGKGDKELVKKLKSENKELKKKMEELLIQVKENEKVKKKDEKLPKKQLAALKPVVGVVGKKEKKVDNELLKKMKLENENLLKKVNEMNKTIEKLNNEKRETNVDKQQENLIKEESDKSQKVNEELNEKVKQFQTQNEKMDKQVEELQKLTESLNSEKKQIEEKTKVEFDSLNVKIETITKEMKSLEEENNSLKKGGEEKSNLLNKSHDELKKKCDQLQKEKDEQITKLNNEIKNSKEEIQACKENMKKTDETLKTQNKEIVELKKINDKLKHDFEQQNKESNSKSSKLVTDLKLKVTTFETQLKGKNNEITNNKATINKLEINVKNLTTNLEELTKEKQAIIKENESIKKMKESVNSEKEKAEKTINQLNQDKEGLNNQLKEIGKKMKEIGKSSAQQDRKFKKVDKERATLKNRVAYNRFQLGINLSKIRKLTEEFEKSENGRRKLHNIVEDAKGKIRVYLRCRPMSKSEKERNCKFCIDFLNKGQISMFDKKHQIKKTYTFNSIFSHESSQVEVYKDSKDLIQSSVDGYNVCIFAYGQTGSGKTYTISGEPGNDGIVPRSIKEIFFLKEKRKKMYRFKIESYMVELYLDKLYDLYSKEQKKELKIKKNSLEQVVVTNVVKKKAESAKELLEQYTEGIQSRHVRSTAMNEASSRSHLILTILVTSQNISSQEVSFGKLSLVDLAGSERQKKTGADKIGMKEAMAINTSLSALGNVISALSLKKTHIPYRDDKLTMLLSDSVGGKAKTLMFVCVSPADYNADESVNSLLYASRTKKIVNKVEKAHFNKMTKVLKHKVDFLTKQLETKVSEEEMEKIIEIMKQSIEPHSKKGDGAVNTPKKKGNGNVNTPKRRGKSIK